jgi:RAP1 GTPase activating protein 1
MHRLKGYSGFTGGLDRDNDEDGKFALIWTDFFSEICFQVSTYIPYSEAYPSFENRFRHIGNNSIVVFFSENPLVDFVEIQSRATVAEIIVQVIDSEMFKVFVRTLPGAVDTSTVKLFGPLFDGQLVNKQSLAILLRFTIVSINVSHPCFPPV